MHDFNECAWQGPTNWITALFLTGLIAGTQVGIHQIGGRVVGISDGDTVTMLDTEFRQHKIRLDGIGEPESGRPFGGASKDDDQAEGAGGGSSLCSFDTGNRSWCLPFINGEFRGSRAREREMLSIRGAGRISAASTPDTGLGASPS